MATRTNKTADVSRDAVEVAARIEAVGASVRRLSDGRVGIVIGYAGPYCQLRDVRGGKEWEADPADLEPAAQSDAFSADVAHANGQSRGARK